MEQQTRITDKIQIKSSFFETTTQYSLVRHDGRKVQTSASGEHKIHAIAAARISACMPQKVRPSGAMFLTREGPASHTW